MYNRKFFALFMLGMLLFTAVMCTGGCGGSSGGAVGVKTDPTPYQSHDVIPVPEPSQIYYTVTFDSDGGSEIMEQTVSQDETVEEPADPAKEGFTFMGWFDPEGYMFDFGVSIDHDILLTAEWAQTVEATQEEIIELTNPEYGGIEIVSFDNSEPLTGVEVQYNTEGFALVSVSTLSDDPMLNAPGLIGRPIEISHIGGEVKEAMITFYYDPLLLSSDANNLGIVWYDESNDILTLLSEDSTIDTTNNAVYVVTEHFSKYGVVDKQKWLEMWNTKLPAVRTEDIHYNVIIAIDCSGSMYGEKMQRSIESAQNLVDTLNDGDFVTVIAFDSYSSVKGSTEITSSPYNNRDTVKNWLSLLYASGGTNIESALNTALLYNKDDTSFRSFVILLSDGQSSVYDSTLLKLRDNGQMVIAVGVGSDVDSQLMQRIAVNTGGNYLYADTASDVQEKFNEIVENDFGSNVDSDGDSIPDNAEKQGMRDQYGQHIITDPNNADTDGDGISDDIEMGNYHHSLGYGDYDHFNGESDPRKYTVKSSLAYVRMSTKGTATEMNSKQFVLTVFVHGVQQRSIGENREYIYSSVINPQFSISFPNDNYKLAEILRVVKVTNQNGTYEYHVSALISYKNYPSVNDRVTWRIAADNLVLPDTADKRTEYIEVTQYVIPHDDPVEDRLHRADRLKAWRAVLEKEFIEKLCANAQQGSNNADKNAELAAKRAALQKNMKLLSGGTVPPEVCEAFALAVLDTYDSDGSKVEKYSKNWNELYQQLLREIASSVRNGEKTIVSGGHTYRVKFTLMNSQGIGVDFASVYRDGVSYATLVWTTSMEDIKSALAEYCAKLAELNKDLWNDFLVSYVDDALKEIGIPVNKDTIEKIFSIAENTIKGLCGDKGAANQVVDELVGAAKDKLKSDWLPWGKNKFLEFVKEKFPKGQQLVKSAEKLDILKSKYDAFKGAIDRYNFASLFGGGDGSDLKNTFEAFKTAYEELGKENLLDVSHPLTSWPEGW